MIVLDKKLVADNEKAYIIAEIGNNHMGSKLYACEMIEAAAKNGANAVKFQKRNNETLFIPKLYNQPYLNKNSFGKTYGEHRKFLEFTETDYIDLIECAHRNHITLFATPFDIESVNFIKKLDFPIVKIQSADIDNIKLIEAACDLGIPLIVSTGGAYFEDIRRAYEFIIERQNSLVIMHCVAMYPTKAYNMSLKIIEVLKKEFPAATIGFSSHYNGILASVGAYMCGANVIEQHFTLDHTAKGTDHALSLQPAGLSELRHYLDELYYMRRDDCEKFIQIEQQKENIAKLGKSLYFKHNVKKNTILSFENICMQSPKDKSGTSIAYFCEIEKENITVKRNCQKGELLTNKIFKGDE